MKRLITCAAAAAALLVGTNAAQAQSLFDLGVYGGVDYHYNWLDDVRGLGGNNNDDGLHPGFAGLVGAHATFWATPRFGVRTNVSYSDVDLPQGSAPRPVNAWFYDLNLVFRPFMTSVDGGGGLLGSSYVWLGGGAFTANPPGQGLGCVQPYVVQGACLPIDWRKATVGQGAAGIGFDIFSLTNAIGLFVEAGGNVYDSPFHTGPGWAPTPATGAAAKDTYGVTGRLAAGLKLAFGALAPAVVPVPVAPAPPPPPPAPAPPPPPATREITVCVVEGNALRTVTATFNPATGDTMVAGQRFATAHPATAPTYAAGANWYVQSDQMRFTDRDWVRFGVTRVIQPAQLQRVGEVQGTQVFAETGATAPYQVLYVPVRPGCEFQPFQPRAALRPRG